MTLLEENSTFLVWHNMLFNNDIKNPELSWLYDRVMDQTVEINTLRQDVKDLQGVILFLLRDVKNIKSNNISNDIRGIKETVEN